MSATLAAAENIDPADDGSQYAWAENLGWLNAEPQGNGGPGVQVDDFELRGGMWGENIGWLSLTCGSTLSCATVHYGVSNDGSGVLSGYAWAENVGWLSFSCDNTSSCATASYGVTIDPSTGDFSGRAWAENMGWVTFASTGVNPYKVKTAWTCDPPPATPSGSPSLSVGTSGSDTLLSWAIVAGATGDDIVRGSLTTLRSTGGDFSIATQTCLDDNNTTQQTTTTGDPGVGEAFWFLVRGANCGGSGPYDSGGAGQVRLRDAEIATSGNDCS